LNNKYDRKCDVDSEHIFHHIADNRPLGELRGYGAVTYIDENKPDTVYMGKSMNGQMDVYAIVEDGKTHKDPNIGIVWASTDTTLVKALKIVGFTAFPYNLKGGQLYKFEDGGVIDAGDFPLSYSGSGVWDQQGYWRRGDNTAGTDWREHPILKSFVQCEVDDKGEVQKWNLDRPDQIRLARMMKHLGKKDHDNGGSQSLVVAGTITRRCHMCGDFKEQERLVFDRLLGGWCCAECKVEWLKLSE
jgi:hypothetical protein